MIWIIMNTFIQFFGLKRLAEFLEGRFAVGALEFR